MTDTERRECIEFWKDIIYKDGKLDEEQVLKELYDFMVAMQEVPKVYCHITGGKLSKINYPASTIIAVADDLISEQYVDKDDLRSLLE